MVNAKKTKCMIFGTKKDREGAKRVNINGTELEYVDKFKYLGVWLRPNLCGNEHVKKRKISAIAAAYRLNTLGLNTNILSSELKSFLIGVYCRSTLQYGIENTYMTQTSYRELEMIEAKIIKKALGLSKYQSTSMIINALDIAPTIDIIKIRKLEFAKQLQKNSLTSRILKEQLNKKTLLSAKSYIKEIVRLTNVNIFAFTPNTMTTICKNEAKKMKLAIEHKKGTKEAIAIRYLLEHRDEYKDELLRKLTHWSEPSIMKKRKEGRTLQREG